VAHSAVCVHCAQVSTLISVCQAYIRHCHDNGIIASPAAMFTNTPSHAVHDNYTPRRYYSFTAGEILTYNPALGVDPQKKSRGDPFPSTTPSFPSPPDNEIAYFTVR